MRKWLIAFVLLVILLTPTPALADTSAEVTVTAVGYIVSAPGGLTLTYVDDFELGLSWIKGDAATPPPAGTDSTVVNTMIRVRGGEPPADIADGYLVYYGDGTNFSDTAVDLTSLTLAPNYRAWTETVFYDVLGDIIISIWEEVGITEEANFMSLSWLFMALALLALGLTVTMFTTKQMLLGYPSAIFWAVLGGFSYGQSAFTWDIYYFVFFAAIGMAIFSMLAMYALREKRDTIGDEDMEKGDGGYVDEKPEPKIKDMKEPAYQEPSFMDGWERGDEFAYRPSRRTLALKERAAIRRERYLG